VLGGAGDEEKDVPGATTTVEDEGVVDISVLFETV